MNAKRRTDVAELTSQLATNATRVRESVDKLSSRIDQMVVAVSRQEWSQVQQMSHQLAQASRKLGYRAVSAMSQRVYDEASKPDNATSIKQSLVRLIGAHGRSGPARLKQTV